MLFNLNHRFNFSDGLNVKTAAHLQKQCAIFNQASFFFHGRFFFLFEAWFIFSNETLKKKKLSVCIYFYVTVVDYKLHYSTSPYVINLYYSF